MSDHTKRSVNSPEKTKIRKWVCGFLLIALLGGFYGCGAYLYSMLHTAEKTITTTYKKVKIKKARNVSKGLKRKKTDFDCAARDRHRRPRSKRYGENLDTLIIATVNRTTRSGQALTSSARDALLKIWSCRNPCGKMNAAYSVGRHPSRIKSIKSCSTFRSTITCCSTWAD